MGKKYSSSKEPKISILMEPTNAAYLIQNMRKGIKFHEFEQMLEFSAFTLSEWATILHLTERTLQRYKQQAQTFDPLQSEKIMQIILLHKKGIDVFGSKEKFDTWLDTLNISLGSIRPKEILDSAFGIDWLQDELGRIEHGILA